MDLLAALFTVEVPALELVVRGTAMYWFLFLLFRFVLRRDAGSIGIADILLLVLIADAAQNGMAGDYRTISEGFVLIATIATWNWLLDWASYHSLWCRRLFERPGVTLVRDGRVDRRSMRQEMVTMDELMATLREHGVESLDRVKLARFESTGEISVLEHEPSRRS